MRWIYISTLWTFVCVIITLLLLAKGVYGMAAFWALLAIISAIYNSVMYAVNIYLRQKYFDFDKELKKTQEEMKTK